MNDLATADLSIIADEINTEHASAFGKALEALEHARRAGELLLQAKERLTHGSWLPWIRENCKFSIRTAQGYMRLASQWTEVQGKCATAAHLPLRDALDLLAERNPALEEFRRLGPGFAEIADRWTGSREDAEEFTRLLGESISADLSAIANRFNADFNIVRAMFFAMLRVKSEAAT